MNIALSEPPADETAYLRDVRRTTVLDSLRNRPRARYAKTNLIRRTIAAGYCDPVPCNTTLNHWFKEAKVPNSGGGKGHHLLWQVAAAEDAIRAKVGLPRAEGGAK